MNNEKLMFLMYILISRPVSSGLACIFRDGKYTLNKRRKSGNTVIYGELQAVKVLI
jgi:hypothetical protein